MASTTSITTPAARYIDSADEANSFLAALRGEPAIALDTEGASYHRFLDRIYLLQISTRETDVIIDPLGVGPLPELVAVLADPAVEIVLHDADYDLRLLRQDYGARVSRIFDTRVAAQLLGVRSFGLAALLERYFDVRLEKKHQRADWSQRPLPPAMLEYAVLDTHYLLRLRDKLRRELEQMRRWHWAKEEFTRIQEEHPGAEPEDPAAAFLRVKGARDLTRRELAALRELVSWRDDLARRLDRAPFRVAGNDILLELARLRPRSVDELSRIRIVPRTLVERNGRTILAAVARGDKVPENELPRFPRAARWERDPGFDDRLAALRKVRDAAAERLGMDGGVLCSRDRLEGVARLRPQSLEELAAVPGMRRWQVEALGEELLQGARS